jgi:AcrR family transcriptional regulator
VNRVRRGPPSSFRTLETTPPPTARGRRTRARLIRAAETVFGQAGYYDARISEITREAGVAMGTFYLYFPSKEALFRALVASLNHDLRRTLSEGTSPLPTRAAAEAEGLRLFFRYLLRHRKLYRIVHEAASVDPALYRQYVERIAQGYQAGLTRAMEAGEVKRVDPELLAYALMGIAETVATRYVIWEDGMTETKFDQLVDLILHGLLVEDGTSRPDSRHKLSARSRTAGSARGGRAR